MFAGLGALVSDNVPSEAVALLRSQGAVILEDIPLSQNDNDDDDDDDAAAEMSRNAQRHGQQQRPTTALFIVGVVSDRGGCQELKDHHRQLKARRMPIVRSAWVLSHAERPLTVPAATAAAAASPTATVGGGRTPHAPEWLPMKYPLAAYDPNVFQGMIFTTSGLVPAAVKANTIALMVFLGAVYTPHLIRECDAVVCSKQHQQHDDNGGGGGSSGRRGASAKVAAAVARGISIVTPTWVQQCYAKSRILPAPAVEHVICNSCGGGATMSPRDGGDGHTALSSSSAAMGPVVTIPVALSGDSNGRSCLDGMDAFYGAVQR